jgi:FkbM family methyltransferase
VLRRLETFAAKPITDQAISIRFFVRKGLARLPYLPLPIRVQTSPAERLTLWWSYVAAPFDPERTLFDYWGHDLGELRFVWSFLRPGMVFFDVGAYHGLYALVAAKKIGETGRVIAFEPSARERRRMRLHLWINRLSAVEVGCCAVGDGEGVRKFFVIESGDDTMNSLRPPSPNGRFREILVDTVTLDGYCQRRLIESIDLMKIDVEGGELAAFRGARRVLRTQRPLMICEVLDQVTEPWGYRARGIIGCLKQFGYRWYEFRQDGTLIPHLEREDYPEVRNYLAVPEEKLSLITSSFSR